MGGDDPVSWAEQRRFAIDRHAEANARREATEAEQARALIGRFVADARAMGLPTVPLVARPYGGRSRYRTGLQGWYVHPNQLMAVAGDGGFYRLAVPPSLRSLLFGVHVEPEQPRLVIGEGGRDGESIPLHDLLLRRLRAGDR